MELKPCPFRTSDAVGIICSCHEKFARMIRPGRPSIRVLDTVCSCCVYPDRVTAGKYDPAVIFNMGGKAPDFPRSIAVSPAPAANVAVSPTPVPERPNLSGPDVPYRPMSDIKTRGIQLLQSSWDGTMALVLKYGTPEDIEKCRRVEAGSKSCNCRSKFPEIKRDLWYKYAIKRFGQESVGNALLLGNTGKFANQGVPFEDFTDVVLFNSVRRKEYVPYADHLACRHSSKPYVYPGLDLDSQLKPTAEFILIDGLHRAAGVTGVLKHPFKLLRARFDMVSGFCDYDVPGKWPSTGFAVLCWYLRRGYHVTLTNFTWEGWVNHGWDHERSKCIQWEREGKIAIVYKEYC